MTTAVAKPFEWIDGHAGRGLVHEGLARRAAHLLTTRDLAFRGDRAVDDQRRLGAALGCEAAGVVTVRQVHGRAVAVVTPGSSFATMPDADAIVSTDPTRAIAVRVADCVPVLLANPRGSVVAAVHAGWRGACAGVIEATVATMAAHGAEPCDLLAVMGPSIGPCCYQVDDRVRDAFLGAHPDVNRWFVADGPGHWRLDLWRAIEDQLRACGVPGAAITNVRLCTAEHLDSCFSYRAEGPGTGRLAAAIRAAL